METPNPAASRADRVLLTGGIRIPDRSRLVSLPPMGVATPDVESATSYIMSLAQSHAVSVRYLLSNEIYRDEITGGCLPWSNWMIRASSANGTGAEASRIVDVLGRLTCRDDLRNLTLLPYKRIVASGSNALKPMRSWCPICLEAMRKANHRIHEKLIWAINPVVICPIHKIPLQTKCPHCGREQAILAAYSVPGFCNRCFKWLGAVDPPDEGRFSEEDLWMSNSVGALVAAGPSVDIDRLIDRYRQAVLQRANQTAGGSVRALSRLGVNYRRILDCLRDRRTVPIAPFLKGAYESSLTVADLIQEQDKGPHTKDSTNESDTAVKPHLSVAFRKEVLQREIDSLQPRSPRALASSLGYNGTAQLWRADRQLFSELKRKSVHAAKLTRSKQRVDQIKGDAKRILEESLSKVFPQSVKELAKEIGDLKEGTLRNWFPQLCKSISAKRDEYKDQECEAQLRRALAEDPVPFLGEVARRSQQTVAILEHRAPNLCRQLSAAHESQCASQTEQLYARVIPLLSEQPPLTVTQIADRLRVPYGAFRYRLSELSKEIAQRAKAHKHEKTRIRIMPVFDEVKTSVAKLVDAGEAPSAAYCSVSLRKVAGLGASE